ncbi:MAG: hypothetical protein NC089_05445 [Bacteroides sp.]|nr:hypothetical protein [Bacteroides sp.]MCM1549068.1 hypothetical protein [Clostridium sp.]
MRITTQMLNNTAKKAGIPFTCGTLLNQVNSSGTGNNLLQALNQKNNTTSNVAQKQEQEKLKKSSDRLQQQAEKFAAENGNSILDNYQTDGENKEIYGTIEGMVTSWNDTRKQLQALPGTLNDFYGQMLSQAAVENKEALSDIGITIGKDGSLKLDSDKLKKADIDSLKKVLSGSESFAEKTRFLAGRISDNAAANMIHASSQYNAAGDVYSAFVNRYDFWS